MDLVRPVFRAWVWVLAGLILVCYVVLVVLAIAGFFS